MGGFLGRVWDSLFPRTPRKILILGLQGVGKTAILSRLVFGQNWTITPTYSVNTEMLDYLNSSLFMWELGGHKEFLPHWVDYFHRAEGLIFVVDSSDRDNIKNAKKLLETLLENELLWDVPVLVYANKRHLPGAMSQEEVTKRLDLQGERFFVRSVCAFSGDGLMDGLYWLTNLLEHKK